MYTFYFCGIETDFDGWKLESDQACVGGTRN